MRTIDRRIDRLEREPSVQETGKAYLLFKPKEDASAADWVQFREQYAAAKAQRAGFIGVVAFVRPKAK